MTNTCSLCQYCRPIEAHEIDMDYKVNWCSNSKSPNFRYWKYDAQKFVKGSDTCEMFTSKSAKLPIIQRIFSKGLTGLKLTKKIKKETVLLLVITALLACGISMEVTLLYLILFQGVLK
jgi:hypothetical protein